ncbi:MAG TPA: hypothetical protein ENK26_10100 [Gammaproteobacteria bacterium]|nr:hypothetical protein [Gammaproteobacteria bacterium]
MSYLKETAPENASGKLAELFTALEKKIGYVPNGFRALSVSEAILERQAGYIDWVMKHPTLSPRFAAILRLLISENKECDYCVHANSAMLQNFLGVSADEIAALKLNPGDAPLDEREKALVLFVLDAIENPREVSAMDIDDLREMGWSDSEILDALYQGAQQVAFDILVTAFNVENDHP